MSERRPPLGKHADKMDEFQRALHAKAQKARTRTEPKGKTRVVEKWHPGGELQQVTAIDQEQVRWTRWEKR